MSSSLKSKEEEEGKLVRVGVNVVDRILVITIERRGARRKKRIRKS